MVLPVQFVNDVRLGNTTEYCPYCSRILYWEPSEDDNKDYSSLSSYASDEDGSDEDALAESVGSSADFDDVL